MSKRKRTVPINQQQQDVDFQKYIKSIQWADDPKKAAAELRKIAAELEIDIDVEDFKDQLDKDYGTQDIRNAKNWFKEEIKNLLANPWLVDHKNMSKYTKRQPAISIPKPTDIGKMFFYGYDPKTKKTMPYYDKFPLILMVKPLNDGFHGLNLHYLPPKQRELLLTRLMDHLTNTKIDNNTRIKLNYGLLKSIGKYRYFKPAFKRYLFSHTKTKIRSIPFRHWASAILLPVAKFKKSSITKVWSDSLKISRGV